MSSMGSRERRMSATEAKVRFGEVLRAVSETEADVVVEKSGNPVAVIVSFDEFKRLKQIAGEDIREFDWWSAMVENATAYRMTRNEKPITDSVELVREMREERDAELRDRLR